VEIPIVGLDCKACSLAVYEILFRLKGVEQATASFKAGKATALIDPKQIDRAELEMALRQRGVQLSAAP
jgi:copper chaperone CopZ